MNGVRTYKHLLNPNIVNIQIYSYQKEQGEYTLSILFAVYCSVPVDTQSVKGGVFVTHGADPSGLPLVHLKIEGGVKALQVGTASRSTRHRHAHLRQLTNTQKYNTVISIYIQNFFI